MIVKIKKLPVSKSSSRKDVKKRLEVGDGAKGSPRRLPKRTTGKVSTRRVQTRKLVLDCPGQNRAHNYLLTLKTALGLKTPWLQQGGIISEAPG